MSNYVPSPVPQEAPQGLRAWLARELRTIADCLDNIDNLRLVARGAEPARFSNGMIIYADGIGFNPGSGEGFYGREAGAWVKL